MLAHRSFKPTADFAVRLAALTFVSTSLGFLIANASFYWLSGRIASPNLAEYWAQTTAYFFPFVGVACAYIAAAALVHSAALLLGSSERRSAA
jgi:NADH:ubiquinone oxidoreductase subunit 5 (subunit L)/multisubunit Na+/H+ antiporter MnhA subunit